MKHSISPTVDCIFKAILGAEENKNLLIHYLNSILKPKARICEVDILNPHAEHWDDIPKNMNTPHIRQAMSVLERFSDEEREYHFYQSRQNAIREELTRQSLLDEANEKLEEATGKLDETTGKLDDALKEKEKFKQMLKDAGIDPDA